MRMRPDLLRLPLLLLTPLLLVGCPAPQYVDVSLEMPSPGFQLTSTSFEVAAGIETQRCFFFAVPGTGATPVWVNRIVATQNPGSHHMTVFRVKTIVNLSGQPGDEVDDGQCFISSNWADWPLVTNLQNSTVGDNKNDWTFPAGVAEQFAPGELLMLQIHYVNATTQQTPGHGKGVVNFYETDASTVQNELGTVFATNQAIKVCPGDTNKMYETSCTFAHTPVTIIGANGHFHSRGVKFEIAPYAKDNKTVGPTFYTSEVWNDPPFLQNLNVQLPIDGGIDWRCTYDYAAPSSCCVGANNTCAPVANGCDTSMTDTCCISFGGHVEMQEHCNAFIYYYPKLTDASCF